MNVTKRFNLTDNNTDKVPFVLYKMTTNCISSYEIK